MSIQKIDVIPYDERWPLLFEKEKEVIFAAAPSAIEGIYHIGSTSVEGLKAKPVIDILLEVANINELDGLCAAFEAIGYECKGEFGIPGRRYYRKGGAERTHQVHAFETGSGRAVRYIAFKEYLKAHPNIANAYGELKLRVAAACNKDMALYCEGKADFIRFHEQVAMAWWSLV